MSASYTVQPLRAEDVGAAGLIQRDAFDTSRDPLHLIFFPASKAATSGYTQEKRDSFASKTFEKDFKDAEATGKVLMGAYDSNNKLVGVAVWIKPGIPVLDKKTEKESVDNEEKNLEMDDSVLESIIVELPKSRYAVMGDTPHWYLKFLLIAPEAQGKGVGSLLMNWGLDQADSTTPSLPVVLESSLMGQPIYTKKGFEIKGWCHVGASDENGKPIEEKTVRLPVMVRPAR